MNTAKQVIRRHFILILCILGAIVRWIYGSTFETWSTAPDHMAWEMALENGGFNYPHLIHYPHEGGTILISLLSKFIHLFSNFSSLAITAFILDFIVRYIQIYVVNTLFSFRTALIFGFWTVCASPIILPWGSTNFGLHHLSSVFPFLLLLFLHRENKNVAFFRWFGAFLGLAIWFSYSNLVLIPVVLIFAIISKEKWQLWINTLVSIAAVLLVHGCVRIYTDAGFHLSEFALSSIRGETFSITDIDIISRLKHVPSVMAQALHESVVMSNSMQVLRVLFYLFFLTAITALFFAKKDNTKRFVWITLACLISFGMVYILSPFFHEGDSGNYVAYRHLTYILPILVLFLISGTSLIKRGYLIGIAFVGVCAFTSLYSFQQEKTKSNDVYAKATGWIIANKFGHKPEAVRSIIEKEYDCKELLIRGIGWGTSSSIFRGTKARSENCDEKIELFIELLNRYPKSYHPEMMKGIVFSFSDQVDPRLDPEILDKMIQKMISDEKGKQ